MHEQNPGGDAPRDSTGRRLRNVRVGRRIAAGLFGVVFAYYLADAVRSLVVLPAEYEALGLGREAAPWALLIAGVLIPPLVYAATLVLARRRSVGEAALVFAAGLATVACLSLGVIALG